MLRTSIGMEVQARIRVAYLELVHKPDKELMSIIDMCKKGRHEPGIIDGSVYMSIGALKILKERYGVTASIGY